MTIFHTLMLWYDDIFSPIYFLLLCALILIYLDHRSVGGSLKKRFVIVLLGWIVGYLIYKTYWWFFSSYPQFIEDFFAVSGMITGIIIIYGLWKYYNYGYELLGAIVASIATLIPYTLISPLWNISGHVAFTTMPVVYILLLSKIRFNKISYLWLLTPIPTIMIIDRPLVNAHTWLQSIGGFLLAFISLAGVLYYVFNTLVVRGCH